MFDAVEKSRIRRGAILAALRLEVGGVSDLALLAYLQGSRDQVAKYELRAELDYLSGKGKEYIEIIERATRLWVVKIAPRGIDLLDERIPEDTGVVIPR